MAGTQLEVNEWLDVIGLGEYKKIFEDEGYDDIGVVAELTEEDLNVLRITKPGTRKKLLLKAKALKATLSRADPVEALLLARQTAGGVSAAALPPAPKPVTAFPTKKSDIIERVNLSIGDDDDEDEEDEGGAVGVAKAKEEAKDSDSRDEVEEEETSAAVGGVVEEGDWHEGMDRIKQRMAVNVQGRLEKVIALKRRLSQSEAERRDRLRKADNAPVQNRIEQEGKEEDKDKNEREGENENETDDEERQRRERKEIARTIREREESEEAMRIQQQQLREEERMQRVPRPTQQQRPDVIRTPTPPPPPPAATAAVATAAANVQQQQHAAPAQQAGAEEEGEVLEVLDADGENRKLFLRDRAFNFRRTIEMFQHAHPGADAGSVAPSASSATTTNPLQPSASTSTSTSTSKPPSSSATSSPALSPAATITRTTRSPSLSAVASPYRSPSPSSYTPARSPVAFVHRPPSFAPASPTAARAWSAPGSPLIGGRVRALTTAAAAAHSPTPSSNAPARPSRLIPSRPASQAPTAAATAESGAAATRIVSAPALAAAAPGVSITRSALARKDKGKDKVQSSDSPTLRVSSSATSLLPAASSSSSASWSSASVGASSAIVKRDAPQRQLPPVPPRSPSLAASGESRVDHMLDTTVKPRSPVKSFESVQEQDPIYQQVAPEAQQQQQVPDSASVQQENEDEDEDRVQAMLFENKVTELVQKMREAISSNSSRRTEEGNMSSANSHSSVTAVGGKEMTAGARAGVSDADETSDALDNSDSDSSSSDSEDEVYNEAEQQRMRAAVIQMRQSRREGGSDSEAEIERFRRTRSSDDAADRQLRDEIRPRGQPLASRSGQLLLDHDLSLASERRRRSQLLDTDEVAEALAAEAAAVASVKKNRRRSVRAFITNTGLSIGSIGTGHGSSNGNKKKQSGVSRLRAKVSGGKSNSCSVDRRDANRIGRSKARVLADHNESESSDSSDEAVRPVDTSCTSTTESESSDYFGPRQRRQHIARPRSMHLGKAKGSNKLSVMVASSEESDLDRTHARRLTLQEDRAPMHDWRPQRRGQPGPQPSRGGNFDHRYDSNDVDDEDGEYYYDDRVPRQPRRHGTRSSRIPPIKYDLTKLQKESQKTTTPVTKRRNNHTDGADRPSFAKKGGRLDGFLHKLFTSTGGGDLHDNKKRLAKEEKRKQKHHDRDRDVTKEEKRSMSKSGMFLLSPRRRKGDNDVHRDEQDEEMADQVYKRDKLVKPKESTRKKSGQDQQQLKRQSGRKSKSSSGKAKRDKEDKIKHHHHQRDEEEDAAEKRKERAKKEKKKKQHHQQHDKKAVKTSNKKGEKRSKDDKHRPSATIANAAVAVENSRRTISDDLRQRERELALELAAGRAREQQHHVLSSVVPQAMKDEIASQEEELREMAAEIRRLKEEVALLSREERVDLKRDPNSDSERQQDYDASDSDESSDDDEDDDDVDGDVAGKHAGDEDDEDDEVYVIKGKLVKMKTAAVAAANNGKKLTQGGDAAKSAGNRIVNSKSSNSNADKRGGGQQQQQRRWPNNVRSVSQDQLSADSSDDAAAPSLARPPHAPPARAGGEETNKDKDKDALVSFWF